MKALNYFKTYKLVEVGRGVNMKMFTFLFIQISIIGLFFYELGVINYFVMLPIVTIFAVFMYSHSMQLDKTNITMLYPISYKKRYFYDLLAPLFYMFLFIAIFIIYILFFVLIAMIFKVGTAVDDASEIFNSFKIYGYIYFILYTTITLFAVQPLKYIKNTKIWYLTFTLLSVALYGLNQIVAVIIRRRFSFAYNIIENFHNATNPLILLLSIMLVTTITIYVSVKIGLKLASK